jgi:lysozyme
MDDLTKALALIKTEEGLRLIAYPDPGTGGGPYTIGWGHTGGVTPGERITMAQAEHFLDVDLADKVSAIKHLVKVPINNNELCALASFVFNIGTTAFYHSTLLFELNRGIDKVTVAEQFLRWVHAGGHVMPGLVTRRKLEARLFLS